MIRLIVFMMFRDALKKKKMNTIGIMRILMREMRDSLIMGCALMRMIRMVRFSWYYVDNPSFYFFFAFLTLLKKKRAAMFRINMNVWGMKVYDMLEWISKKACISELII